METTMFGNSTVQAVLTVVTHSCVFDTVYSIKTVRLYLASWQTKEVTVSIMPHGDVVPSSLSSADHFFNTCSRECLFSRCVRYGLRRRWVFRIPICMLGVINADSLIWSPQRRLDVFTWDAQAACNYQIKWGCWTLMWALRLSHEVLNFT